MKPLFYIVDDDPSIRRILSNIIEEYCLGHIIGESETGLEAISEIIDLKPDIILVDLLIPNIDGIEIVKKVKKKEDKIQFIMISQVNSKEMVGEAYKSGIEFFINKPINVIEVVSVIEKAIENINLKNALLMIEKTLQQNKSSIFQNKENDTEHSTKNIKEASLKIFSDLGILGEAGSDDLLSIIEMIIKARKELGVKIHKYKVGEIYRDLNSKYEKQGKPTVSIKTIEQRIRRIIQSALQNIASIGIEDYSNSKFEKYSTSLFEFKEVRQEMDYIREKTKYRGKINIKKFIEGILTHLDI